MIDSVATVQRLNVSFRNARNRQVAIKNISLSVGKGEVLAVVGESGSGKSVLGLSMLGLLPSHSRPEIGGAIDICGVDVTQASPGDLRRLRQEKLGAVFQDPMTSLNPSMTIGEQVAEAAGSRSDALRVLASVAYPEAERRYSAFPHQLSGGLRQRVMIAIAIACRPSLIIADEPTTALDVTVQAQILALFKDIQKQTGSSFLFVTHDLAVAGQIADRIAVVYGGRLMEIGDAAEILTRPKHPYTASLMASKLTLEKSRRHRLGGVGAEIGQVPSMIVGCPFAPRCHYKIAKCEEEVEPVRAAGSEVLTSCIRSDEITGYMAPGIQRGDESTEIGPASIKPRKVVSLHRLSKTFSIRRQWWSKREKLPVLRDFSLAVREGESVSLVGESGSGKSTVLRIVAGLIQPDEREGAECFVEGQPKVVFQDAASSFTPWVRVGEQVEEAIAGVSNQRERRRRVDQTLARVGLRSEIRQALPSQLSGGQLQRLALARAIVDPPSILLFDEPTSALDVSLAAQILNLLQEIRADLGLSFLFVTHDLAVARYISDRIAVIYMGEIVEVGPSEDVIASPAHPYTQMLLNSLPKFEAKSNAARGEIGSALTLPEGCPFHLRCPRVVDKCREVSPKLTAIRADHDVSCWVVAEEEGASGCE